LELAEIRQMMALQGLSMLVTEAQTAETATAHRLNSAKQHSKLALAALGLADCLERANQFAAEYLGLGEDAGGEVKVTTEFDVAQYDATIGTLLVGLADGGHLTTEQLLKELKQRGVLSDTFDVEAELGALDEQSADKQKQSDAMVAAFASRYGAPPASGDNGAKEPVEAAA